MRRLLVLAALSVVVAVGRPGPVGALSPVPPTTTTRPVVITEPEGLYDDPTTAPATTGPATTTAPATTGPPIGGPDGDVVDPGPADRLLPGAAVAGAVVLLAGAGAVLVARRRRPVRA